MKRYSRLELIVDCIWVAFSAWYVVTAQSYPGAARFVPTVIGGVSLVVSVVQLLGNFVAGLAPLTKGGPDDATPDTPAVPAVPAASPPEAVEAVSGESPPLPAALQNRRQLTIILWAFGLLGGLYLFGYQLTVPLFMLAYFAFAYRVRWAFALGAAVFMGLFTSIVFVNLMGITLPNGLLLQLLGA